jgi:alanine dehydrogenase
MSQAQVGIPRETGPGEGRVAATPSAVAVLAKQCVVRVEQDAGIASGFSDEDFIRAGAEIVPTAEELYGRSSLIWKVLRPYGHELSLLKPGHTVAGLLYMGEALPEGVQELALEKWEQQGVRPVAQGLGAISGRLAIQQAAIALSTGKGIFLGGVPGVEPARVLVIGAGLAGRAAAEAALALGAMVTVLDYQPCLYGLPGCRTLMTTPATVERCLGEADVVVVAVRAKEGRAPRIASRGALALMQQGSVVVDMSITEGGGMASTPVTSLENPVAVVEGICHIGVPNLAGAVPRTASVAMAQGALARILEEIAV